MSAPAYAELQVTGNFSFLRGASHGEEYVAAASALGYAAIAVTDRNTLAGVVRFHGAAKQVGMKFIVGARIDMTDAPSVLVYPTDRAAYGRLSLMLSTGKLRAEKGQCLLTRGDLLGHAEGLIAIAVPPENEPDAAFITHLQALKESFGDRAYLAASHLYRGDDRRRIAALASLGLPLVATNDAHHHVRERRALQDVLTCIREKCTIAEAGFRLAANAERHLKPPEEMARLFAEHPDAIARTVEIADRCQFSLDELRYEYPLADVPDGLGAQDHLTRLTWTGAATRYPDGIPEKVRSAINHELGLIDRLNYAPYFLTVHEIVSFAVGKEILCQGRGSAANSAVCYVLGITAVDPTKTELLFERFISENRNEPPDIDVDFEHERREEVIQHIYEKYGRDKAGLAATVISYRARSAMRDVGKAMGLSADAVDTLARTVWGWGRDGIDEGYVREAGLDPRDANLMRTLALARELVGFPRHLSQHVGGFVISRGPLGALVPIENAAMEDRTVIEWDKDDLDTLGLLKIDVLALGMLTCLRKGFDLLKQHRGIVKALRDLNDDDPVVYDMLCKADSLGVFQVESRAQMSMLPRLKPRKWYDLVVQVAIVRPGPIQGDMVHPYLRRRQGLEKPDLPKEELKEVLGRTLGVPLFQEQAMKIAIVAAGFTPSEADQLRRAMAAWRRSGSIEKFRDKMIMGMVARGYTLEFAARCFKQIEGFGEYGFPESHAASFALLVYASSWMKCHHPAVFACALLNSQPMGFYAPAQIVRDAREHGVVVRPVDVNTSDWDNIIERCPESTGGLALRLGFRQIKGAREADVIALMQARGDGYRDIEEVWRKSGLPTAKLETYAKGDAFAGLGFSRRDALWRIKAFHDSALPLLAYAENNVRGHNEYFSLFQEPTVLLPRQTLGEQVIEDYRLLRLTLRKHPLALLRTLLKQDGVTQNAGLAMHPVNRRVTVAGLVLVRQQPGTAKGIVFATLEDETGIANVIIWPDVFERHRRIVLGSLLLRVTGKLQRSAENVIHIVAEQMANLSPMLSNLGKIDGDENEIFEGSLARADEVKRPGQDPRHREEMRHVMPSGRNFH